MIKISRIVIMERQRVSDGSEMLLHVGIQFGNLYNLEKLDVGLSMEVIVRDLCKQWQIRRPATEMALWTVDAPIYDGTRFMSDKNKHLVKAGAILVLKLSPQRLVNKLIQRLLDCHEEGLAEIAAASNDTEVLKIFYAEKTHELVFGIMEQNLRINLWIDGIEFILRLYRRRLLRKIPGKVIHRLFVTIGHALQVHEEFLVQALNLLAAVRRFGRLRYQEELFDHLEILLLMRNQPKVQTSALQLLNYLALFPNNEQEETQALARVLNQKVVGIICDCILAATPSKQMQQELYQFELLALRPYWTKKVTKVQNNDPEMEIVRRLTNRAKRGELTYKNSRRRIFSEGEKNLMEAHQKFLSSWKPTNNVPASPSSVKRRSQTLTTQILNKLSPKKRISCVTSPEQPIDNPFDTEFYFPGPIFYVPLPKTLPQPLKKKAASTTNLNTMEKFGSSKEIVVKDPSLTTKAYSHLTVCNLRYQAKNYPEQYEQWALTKGRKELFAEKLTFLVCRLLEIGKTHPPESPGDNYHPLLFFTYPFIEEELFCEAFALYEKTSREMKARVEKDIVKVLTVVSEQIACALNPRPGYFESGYPNIYRKPQTMAQLRDILSLIHYDDIEEKRRKEREDRMKNDLENKPIFLNHRAECLPSVMELIKDHRMRFISEGHHLPKVSGKGEILQGRQEFIKLIVKGEQFLTIGDCFKECDHSKNVAVAEIVDVSAGKQSKFYKDVFTQNDNWSKTRQQPKHGDCFFSLKLRDNTYLDFCADDVQRMHYWTDAINLLLGKPMTSSTMEAEKKDFLDLSVRLKFLDVEDLPLPDEPPAVPPPPANYNFCLGP